MLFYRQVPQGITLLEVLVVISIIVAISFAGIPRVMSSVNGVALTKNVSYFRHMLKQARTYAISNRRDTAFVVSCSPSPSDQTLIIMGLFASAMSNGISGGLGCTIAIIDLPGESVIIRQVVDLHIDSLASVVRFTKFGYAGYGDGFYSMSLESKNVRAIMDEAFCAYPGCFYHGHHAAGVSDPISTWGFFRLYDPSESTCQESVANSSMGCQLASISLTSLTFCAIPTSGKNAWSNNC